jgi:hypothetical protein
MYFKVFAIGSTGLFNEKPKQLIVLHTISKNLQKIKPLKSLRFRVINEP